jgi:RNA polymerase sigma-70 factor, ECF subfamily
VALADVDVRALIEQHRAGDSAAFEEIVRLHSPSLLAAAKRRLGSDTAAQDAVQETFIRAYRAMPRFDGDLRLAAWLHRICTNVCFDEFDRRRRDQATFDRLTSWRHELPVGETVDADDDSVDPSDEVRRHELQAALKQIPPQYREALELHYGHDRSFKDIGDQLGVSEENARARASRGRKALRKLMAVPSAAFGVFFDASRRGGDKAVHALTADGGATASTATSTASTSSGMAHHLPGLTQFINDAAPTVTRLAVEVGPTVANKTPVIATAVAAATAVAVPVAAVQVADTVSPPAPAAVTAAPATVPTTLGAPSTTVLKVAPATTINAALSVGAGQPAPSVSPAAGPSAVVAAAPTTLVVTTIVVTTAPPTTLAPTTLAPTTAAPTTQPPTTVATTLPQPIIVRGGQFSVAGSGQRFDLSGPITVSRGGSVAMSGFLALGDAGAAAQDPVSVELSLAGTLPTGEPIELRIRSRSVVTGADGSLSLTFNGPFRLSTSAAGYPSKGSASGTVSVNGGSGSLDLSLS